MIKNQTIKTNVGLVIEKVFEKVWDEEKSEAYRLESLKLGGKADLKEKINQLTSLAITAKSEILRNVYEKQIEEAAFQVELLDETPLKDLDLSVPYQTALDKVVCLLKEPYKYWQKLGVVEKQKTFFFIFEGKLFYSRKEGYQTDKTLCYTRLFEQFAASNSLEVEMEGVEPSSIQV